MISACAKLKLKPKSKFGLELCRAKLLREFLPSRISMKIGSGRKRKRASPMFCRNLFQSQNKPFTSQPNPSQPGRNTLMNISRLLLSTFHLFIISLLTTSLYWPCNPFCSHLTFPAAADDTADNTDNTADNTSPSQLLLIFF